MYLKVLIFLLSTSVLAQTDVVITSVVHSVISGQTEYYRIKDRQLYADGNKEYKEYSEKWHLLQYPEMLSGIGIGVAIGINDDLSIESVVKETLLAGSIRWVVRDAIYNLNLHRNMFHISDVSYDPFKDFGTWAVKLGLLTIIILWNYL